MKFEDLNTIGSLPHNSSSFSLSGALLSENNNISFHISSHSIEENSQPSQLSLPSTQSYSQFRGNNDPVSVQSNIFCMDGKFSMPFQGSF